MTCAMKRRDLLRCCLTNGGEICETNSMKAEKRLFFPFKERQTAFEDSDNESVYSSFNEGTKAAISFGRNARNN